MRLSGTGEPGKLEYFSFLRLQPGQLGPFAYVSWGRAAQAWRSERAETALVLFELAEIQGLPLAGRTPGSAPLLARAHLAE